MFDNLKAVLGITEVYIWCEDGFWVATDKLDIPPGYGPTESPGSDLKPVGWPYTVKGDRLNFTMQRYVKK